MEQETNKAKEYIRKLVEPIFNKAIKKRGFLHETYSDHSMVGSGTQKPQVLFLFQPHNHRLYFDFSKENFNPKKPPNHTLQKFKSMVAIFNNAYTYTALNYDSEHKYEKFMFCTIRVKKNQVEVVNHSHDKQWRKITAGTVEEVDERIDVVMDNMKDDSIKALRYFIELHGGKSNFNILNERVEHGIHGDDFIDKIPMELIINDTYVKKVYKAKTEFKSTAAIKNYVSNRSIEKISPDIASELNKLHLATELTAKEESVSTVKDDLNTISSSLVTFGKSQELFAENIRSHLKLINEYRQEVQEMRKPFFVRWWEYFKK